MRTTNQNHPVYRYMIESIDSSNYAPVPEPTSDKEKLAFVLSCFRQEYDFEIKRKGEYVAFKEWLSGLPSCFNIDFENYKILQLAYEWESLTPKASEKRKDDILLNWFNFITVKFFQLCKRNGVK